MNARSLTERLSPARLLTRRGLFILFISLGFLACEKQWDKATVPELMEALRDRDETIRSRVATELGRRGDAVNEAIPLLIEALGDPDIGVRWSAAETLSKIEPAPPISAMPALLGLLQDPHSVRANESAATALGRMGPAAIPGLMRCLGVSSSLSSRATLALAMIGPPAIPSLIEALSHENGAVRQDAAWAFQQMGAKGAPALEHLVQALTDSDAFVRQCAAEALGTFGADSAVAVPMLERLLDDPEPEVREKAETALRKIREARP